jgi:hypothetical protein
VKNTSWELPTLKEIERLEQRLERGNFVKGETSISREKNWRGWITSRTAYSSGEEFVAIYTYQRSTYDHPIYDYDRGDVIIRRVGEENYRKILLGLA